MNDLFIKMADTPAVSTVQVIDPRIEPQPEPVYLNTISADQNQFYKIPASGISDSYITFNNLTTLGKDRAYLDTFEYEITAEIRFRTGERGGWVPPPHGYFMPVSFPFNSVCEQVRVNINGGAFFANPMATIRAKERYWDEERLQESFANHTPCQKAYLQDELGAAHGILGSGAQFYQGIFNNWRSRMFGQQKGFAARANSPLASTNFSIIPNYSIQNGGQNESVLLVTWREPIFCSPFSSRYDATYGRPLYNITSIDISINMGDLRNMFLLVDRSLDNYEVHIKACQLCYQVLTVTAPINHSFTVVPYRHYVPYITDIQGPNPDGSVSGNSITTIKATSGVYTLNEVPTAIWVFLAPALSEYQRFNWDGVPANVDPEVLFFNNSSRYTNNKLFGFMKHISISCGNTTQILNTASVYDLYRIAKANGCKDSFDDWARSDPFDLYQRQYDYSSSHELFECDNPLTVPGCGSVLRLIPGTDIVLPEQRLVPGSNANNLVFQVEADFEYVGLGDRPRKIALWLLFEYVGVASITPGNCVVTMNPLGNGAIMAAAPTISGTSSENEATPSTTEGSGWLDKLKSALGVANKLAKDTKIVSSALKYIPGVGELASNIASQFGYGYKRPRMDAAAAASASDGGSMVGGAVMGLGDFC